MSNEAQTNPYYDLKEIKKTSTGKKPKKCLNGVNVFLIDNGIIIDHNDFSLTNRNVTCDAIITEDDFDEALDQVKMRYCIGNEEDTEDLYAAHGTVVGSIVGGKTYGVAKNDNIHDCCG
ncbi:hypothetical protein H8356DRAFT_1068651 [Neocallimastix lanati (nom. inval.)]|nr:hypothetical protein H8356DRAFT_1068651 [Neocallimastix sp. JGI-2020a]